MAKEKKKKSKNKEKSEKSDVKRIKGTIIPVAFADFVEMLEDLGELTHKGTISTLSNDDVGVFMSIPKQGSSADKISLFLNKSRGWDIDADDYPALEIDEWHTGDVRVSVSDSGKAMKQAFKVAKAWMKAKDEHTPTPSKKGKGEGEEEEPKKKKGKGKKAKSENGEAKEEKSAKRKKRKKKAKEEASAEA